MNLATKTKYVNIVIRVKGYTPNVDKIKLWCEENCEDYYFIIHDKDLDNFLNIVPIHCHLVLILRSSQRLQTTLNSITKFLGIPTTGVEIDKTSSFEGSIHYLIHKDNLKKHQYDKESIISNVPLDEISSILDSVARVIDFTYFREMAYDSDTLLDFISKIGINVYNQYYKVAKDIFWEVQRYKYC